MLKLLGLPASAKFRKDPVLMPRTMRAVIACCVAVALFPGFAKAQDQGTAINSETVKALVQQVQELQAQVKSLQSQVAALSANTNSPSASASSQTTAAPITPARPAASPAMAEMMKDPGTSEGSILHSPRLNLRGYGDVDWNVSDVKGTTDSFALGQFNLFLTSRLSE